MTIFNEREGFSKRLKQALRAASHSSNSPTSLAREFNARYGSGNITLYAARKWLQGEAIPTQGKLRVLANWLGVSAEWLRFGGNESMNSTVIHEICSRFNAADIKLLADIQRLDNSCQLIVREIVHLLVRVNRMNTS